MRDLTLSVQKAELLASRKQENDLVQKNVVVAHYKNRDMDLSTVFRPSLLEICS